MSSLFQSLHGFEHRDYAKLPSPDGLSNFTFVRYIAEEYVEFNVWNSRALHYGAVLLTTSGEERMRAAIPKAHALVFLASLTTTDLVQLWKLIDDAVSQAGTVVPMRVLVGTHADKVSERRLDRKVMESFAAAHGMPYFETSALDEHWKTVSLPFDAIATHLATNAVVPAIRRVTLDELGLEVDDPERDRLSQKYWAFGYLNWDDRMPSGFGDRSVVAMREGTAADVKNPVILKSVKLDAAFADASDFRFKKVLAGLKDSDRAGALARFVVSELGGTIVPALRESYSKLVAKVSSGVLKFSALRESKCGLTPHRAVLFKYLADRNDIKCRLARCVDTGAAWNVVLDSKQQPVIIDLRTDAVPCVSVNSFEAQQITFGAPAERLRPDSKIDLIATPYDEFGAFTDIYSGPFGTVRRTAWRGSDVVLKELRPAPGNNVAYDERLFKHESGVLYHFRHPNVVRLLVACEYKPAPTHAAALAAVAAFAAVVPARFAIITEFVGGGDLKSLIETRGATNFPLAERVGVLIHVAEAIHALHARGMMHRDLKPGNVLITTDKPPRAKLCDFGLARYCSVTGTASTQHTNAGTVNYMAPEQHNDEKLSFATDVYAFGAVMYHVLFGEMPWRGKTSTQVMMFAAVQKRAPPPLPSPDTIDAKAATAAVAAFVPHANAVDSKSNPAVYATLLALMSRCYSFEPTARPGMYDVLTALYELFDKLMWSNASAAAMATATAAADASPCALM